MLILKCSEIIAFAYMGTETEVFRDYIFCLYGAETEVFRDYSFNVDKSLELYE